MNSFIHNNVEIFWYKHAGFKIKTPDGVIVIDPYLVAPQDERADILFLSHDHSDHFDPESVKNVVQKDTHVFCSQDLLTKVQELVAVEAVTSMQPHQEIIYGHLKVYSTPAYNVELPYHPKEKGWLGFLIEVEGVKIYFVGDSDDLDELHTIQCDILLVPIGGIFAMDANDAANFANAIKPKIMSVPMHWGCLVTEDKKPVGTLADAEEFCKKCISPSTILTPIDS